MKTKILIPSTTFILGLLGAVTHVLVGFISTFLSGRSTPTNSLNTTPDVTTYYFHIDLTVLFIISIAIIYLYFIISNKKKPYDFTYSIVFLCLDSLIMPLRLLGLFFTDNLLMELIYLIPSVFIIAASIVFLKNYNQAKKQMHIRQYQY